jgi:hypothetical protein
MSALVAIEKIKNELQNAMRQSATGTFFIKSPDEHAFVVTAVDGAVVSVMAGLLSGDQALAQLATLEQLRFTFNHKPFTVPAAAASAGKPVRQSSATGFQERALAIISEQLTQFIGPFAQSLIDDLRRSLVTELRSPQDCHMMIWNLAKEIDDSGEADGFIRDTSAALQNLSLSSGPG